MSEVKLGVVKWFNSTKGYGFVGREDGEEDVFVHFRDIVGDGYRSLEEGQTVEFTLAQGDKGLFAENVTLVS